MNTFSSLRLYEEISGEGLSYEEIVELANDIKDGKL